MTNNENKTALTAEDFRKFAKGEVLAKYPTLIDLTMEQVDGIIMMIQPLLYQVEQSQSALGEKDFIIKKKDEIIESQKQTFDSLLKKYEAKDKEIEGLKDLIENRAMFQDEQDNKQEIIESQSLRIKELEEGMKNLIDAEPNSGASKVLKSLLSKEQKEGE